MLSRPDKPPLPHRMGWNRSKVSGLGPADGRGARRARKRYTMYGQHHRVHAEFRHLGEKARRFLNPLVIAPSTAILLPPP